MAIIGTWPPLSFSRSRIAADGYVTVDYDGATGWVYADLIAREDEVG